MKDELFKSVIINEFNDTQENIDWLVKNDYIIYSGITASKKHYYHRRKKFKWCAEILDISFSSAIGGREYVISNHLCKDGYEG